MLYFRSVLVVQDVSLLGSSGRFSGFSFERKVAIFLDIIKYLRPSVQLSRSAKETFYDLSLN